MLRSCTRQGVKVSFSLGKGTVAKIAAFGDATRGGAMEAIGEPALNNSGVIAFPAAILKGPVLGGIFIAGARPLLLVVRAGDMKPGGAMIQRMSEPIAIGESDAITFGAFVGGNGSLQGAVLRAGARPDLRRLPSRAGRRAGRWSLRRVRALAHRRA